MLEMAVTIADDEADPPEYRRLSQACKDDLEQLFEQQFDRMLQQQQTPAESQLRSWIRHQLGIKELSYGCDSDSDSDTNQAAAQPVQAGRARQQRQQQQQQQKEPQAPPRRSSRPNIGKMGSSYDAQFGPTMGNSAGASGSSGGGGRQGSRDAQQQMPLTPAAAAPKPRPSRPGRKR
jgi:hypothetical protein